MSENCHGVFGSISSTEEDDEASATKPSYYRTVIHGVEVDVNDIVEAFGLGPEAHNILKYVVRAGRKDETKFVEDLTKCRVYLERLIRRQSDPDHIRRHPNSEPIKAALK